MNDQYRNNGNRGGYGERYPQSRESIREQRGEREDGPNRGWQQRLQAENPSGRYEAPQHEYGGGTYRDEELQAQQWRERDDDWRNQQDRDRMQWNDQERDDGRRMSHGYMQSQVGRFPSANDRTQEYDGRDGFGAMQGRFGGGGQGPFGLARPGATSMDQSGYRRHFGTFGNYGSRADNMPYGAGYDGSDRNLRSQSYHDAGQQGPRVGGGQNGYGADRMNFQYGGNESGYARNVSQYNPSRVGSERRGPKGYKRSDDRIREEVCECLSDHSELDSRDIEVKVENCEVTLTGTVSDRRAKWLAEELIDQVRGVDDVHNQLRVKRATQGAQSGHDRSERETQQHEGKQKGATSKSGGTADQSRVS